MKFFLLPECWTRAMPNAVWFVAVNAETEDTQYSPEERRIISLDEKRLPLFSARKRYYEHVV
jgi:hypothetical protein